MLFIYNEYQTSIYSLDLQVCDELKTEREELKGKLGLTVPLDPTGRITISTWGRGRNRRVTVENPREIYTTTLPKQVITIACRRNLRC